MTGRAEPSSDPLYAHCLEMAQRAARARIRLGLLTGSQRTALLHDLADALRAAAGLIIEANALDLKENQDLSPAMRDRLVLNEQRIEAMAAAVDQIAAQPDPVGKVVDGRELPNGIRLEKRRVPIGVILIVYESRPNVTSDAAALCLKAGNAILLKGGREAAHSNRAIVAALASVLARADLADAVCFVDTTDRESLRHLLSLSGVIDLAVPRGGPGLMKAVTEVARIPVVKHDAGNCHVYLDRHIEGMHDLAERIVVNAKTQRPGVCNAAETLIVHAEAAPHVLPRIGKVLTELGVELRADDRARTFLPGARPATDADWAEEYLDLVLAVRIVDTLEEACTHIRTFGSSHTECIVTSSIESADRFVRLIDSANVMINCSTRFADGGEYGLGAEIGISTDKLHARGPMGAEDLTTFQWVLAGNGQIRT